MSHRFAGRVVDPEGAPVGATVMFTDPSPPHRDIAGWTDGDGRFDLGRVAAGRWTVLAVTDDGQRVTCTVEVAGDVDVTLRVDDR